MQVTKLKPPGPEDLSYDFLWRINRALPERGRIGIFNRSHYEEVLIVRVHPELLEKQRLPERLVTEHISGGSGSEPSLPMKRYLARQGFVILKFFLHLSKQEQKRRFVSRLEEPQKHWKFDAGDSKERGFWND